MNKDELLNFLDLTVETNTDLQNVITFCIPLLEKMNVTNIDKVPVLLSNKIITCGMHTRKENKRNGKIFIKKGLYTGIAIISFVHEIGHEVTITGSVDQKLIAESTARSFEDTFMCIFEDETHIKLQCIRDPFSLTLKKSGLMYSIGSKITWSPLHKQIKSEYRKNLRRNNIWQIGQDTQEAITSK